MVNSISQRGAAVKVYFLFDEGRFLMSLKTKIKINAFQILTKTAVKSHEIMLQFIVAS